MQALDGTWRRRWRAGPPEGLADALRIVESRGSLQRSGSPSMSPVTARLLAVEGAVEPVLEELAVRDIGVWAWKGIDYARSLYPDPAMRPMSDADLFVRPGDMLTVCREFRLSGWSVSDPGTPLVTSGIVGAVTARRGPVEVDLHCHPLYFPWSLPGSLPQDVFDSPRRLGRLLNGFCWRNALLFHLLHMASHSTLRAVWWLDLALLCGMMAGDDWRSLSYWGVRSGLGGAMAEMLADCMSAAGRGAPDTALAALRRGPSRRGLQAPGAEVRGLPTLTAALAGTGWRRTSFCAAVIYRLATGRPAAVPAAAP